MSTGTVGPKSSEAHLPDHLGKGLSAGVEGRKHGAKGSHSVIPCILMSFPSSPKNYHLRGTVKKMRLS